MLHEKTHYGGLVEARMTRNVPVLDRDMSIGEARVFLASTKWDSINYLYRTDAAGRLMGVCSVRKLMYAKDEMRIAEIMKEPLVVAHPHTHQERAALLAVEHNIKAIPVVDTRGTFLGVVPSDEILQILHEEHVEDLLRSSGIGRTKVITDIFKAHISELIALRLPWLLLGFVIAMATAIFATFFEGVIAQEVALVFFMPAVVYMSGAVGTQTQTLFIRALALRHHKVAMIITREFVQGLAIGSLAGIFAFISVLLISDSLLLACVVAFSMASAILAAVVIGIAIPYTLNLMGRDPAFGSGPFVTVITDLVGITLYLTIATLVFL